MQKAIFFDIDGTIWDFDNYIPESTKETIRLLGENGHLTFLCSGRARAFIRNPALLSLGFDGVISGGGTMIEYHGDRLFYKKLANDLVAWTIETIRSYGFRPILEGWNYLYMDDAEFAGEPYGQKVKREAAGHLKSIAGSWGNWEISKLSCATDNADRKACFAAMEPYYDFCIHNEEVAEFLPKGFDKSTGILKLCELLDLDPNDTYAFGDGANDLGMFQVAGTAVAMGNASASAKKRADYVTDDLHEDGIRNACRHFRLL